MFLSVYSIRDFEQIDWPSNWTSEMFFFVPSRLVLIIVAVLIPDTTICSLLITIDTTTCSAHCCIFPTLCSLLITIDTTSCSVHCWLFSTLLIVLVIADYSSMYFFPTPVVKLVLSNDSSFKYYFSTSALVSLESTCCPHWYWLSLPALTILASGNQPHHAGKSQPYPPVAAILITTRWGISEGCHQPKNLTDWNVPICSYLSVNANSDFSDTTFHSCSPHPGTSTFISHIPTWNFPKVSSQRSR